MSAWLTWLKEIGCAGAGQLQEHSPWGAAQQAQSGACHPPWRACHLLWQSDRTPCKQRLPHRRHVRAKHSAPRRQGLQQALQSHVHAPPSMAESVDCRYGSLCCCAVAAAAAAACCRRRPPSAAAVEPEPRFPSRFSAGTARASPTDCQASLVSSCCPPCARHLLLVFGDSELTPPSVPSLALPAVIPVQEVHAGP